MLQRPRCFLPLLKPAVSVKLWWRTKLHTWPKGPSSCQIKCTSSVNPLSLNLLGSIFGEEKNTERRHTKNKFTTSGNITQSSEMKNRGIKIKNAMQITAWSLLEWWPQKEKNQFCNSESQKHPTMKTPTVIHIQIDVTTKHFGSKLLAAQPVKWSLQHWRYWLPRDLQFRIEFWSWEHTFVHTKPKKSSK